MGMFSHIISWVCFNDDSEVNGDNDAGVLEVWQKSRTIVGGEGCLNCATTCDFQAFCWTFVLIGRLSSPVA